MQIQVVLLVVLVAIGTTMVLSAEVEEDEELDPFDMVNFDHANMKMRRKVPADSKPEPEQPSTKEKLQETERPPPKEDKVPEPPPPTKRDQQAPASGKQDKVQEAVPGSCPALSLFQQLVSRLLRFISGKVSQMDVNTPTELCVRMRLTSDQVEMLENFKRDNSKDRVFGAHDILNEAIQGVHVLNGDDPILRFSWVEEYFGVTVDKALQIFQLLACVVVLAVALPKVRLSGQLFRWVLVSGFVISVGMTWYRLYKGEVAKQHEALMKDLPKGCTKMEDGGSTWGSIVNFFKYQFTFQKDACVTYYEHLIVDPIVRVSPMEALTVAVVQTLLKPMRTVGTEISEFIRALVKDLPVQWQMISVTLVVILLVFILFLTCGYRVRIPFLLALEPSHGDNVEVKALKETIHQLRETMQNMEALNRPPAAQPQPFETVGPLPATENPPAIGSPPAVAIPPASANPTAIANSPSAATKPVEQGGGVPTGAARSRQHSQPPFTTPPRFPVPIQEENTSRRETEQSDRFEEREADSGCAYRETETLGAVGRVDQSGDCIATDSNPLLKD